MYKFRYSRIVEVKEKLIDKKQRDLEAAATAVDAVTKDIEKLDGEMDSTFDDMSTGCRTGKEFSVLKDYLSYLDQQKLGLMVEKERRSRLVDDLRAELLNLTIELKMLEKLKDKWALVARKAENVKEQKLMDDIGLRRDRF
jgi:flagellar protein FliJ